MSDRRPSLRPHRFSSRHQYSRPQQQQNFGQRQQYALPRQYNSGPNGYQSSPPTDYRGPNPTGYQGPNPTGYQSPNPTGYQSPNPTGYQGSPNGYQSGPSQPQNFHFGQYRPQQQQFGPYNSPYNQFGTPPRPRLILYNTPPGPVHRQLCTPAVEAGLTGSGTPYRQISPAPAQSQQIKSEFPAPAVATPGPALTPAPPVPLDDVNVKAEVSSSSTSISSTGTGAAEDVDDTVDYNEVGDGLRIYKLGANEELRFEVEGKNEVYIKLLLGLSEIFGSEMIRGKEYVIRTGMKIAIFTYHGCTVQLKGKAEFVYKSSETSMLVYLNTYGAIETLRRAADRDKKRGPIIMVVGPNDVGKTTLCRILLNYSTRYGRRPIFVDLDVSEGTISLPGTVGAILFNKPASIEGNGFDQKAPLSFFYGSTDPLTNPTLYHLVCKNLATLVHGRLSSESSNKYKSSGIIINTCGQINGAAGYNCLKKLIEDFEVDAVLVLDQERLHKELTRDMKQKVSNIVFLSKSPGVVERSIVTRSEQRDRIIHQYFYGTSAIKLHPHSFNVNFSQVQIFKIGLTPVPASCLPIGYTEPKENRTKLQKISPSCANLLHRILALSYIKDIDVNETDKKVVETNILGYICVNEVDLSKGRMTILSPQPGPLPRAILLVSDIQYMDY